MYDSQNQYQGYNPKSGWRKLHFENEAGEEWIFITSSSGKDILLNYMRKNYDAKIKVEAFRSHLHIVPGGSELTTGPRGLWTPQNISAYSSTYLLTDAPKLLHIMENYSFHIDRTYVAFPIGEGTMFMSETWVKQFKQHLKQIVK